MKMKIALAIFLGCAAACLARPALGQTYNMQLTGVSGVISVDPTTGNDNVYGGLYYGTINGTPINIVCDDANDDVSIGLTWTATELNATQIANNLGSTLFGTNSTAPPAPIGVVGYAEVATLIEDMFNSATTSTQQGEISTAIWAITSGQTLGLTGGAQTYYNNAMDEFGSGSLSTQNSNPTSVAEATAALAADGNLALLTPSPNKHGVSQEYWTTVPEGGSALLYLLLAGSTCLGGVLFRYRSQFANRGAA